MSLCYGQATKKVQSGFSFGGGESSDGGEGMPTEDGETAQGQRELS
jgi:hypothetical protein